MTRGRSNSVSRFQLIGWCADSTPAKIAANKLIDGAPLGVDGSIDLSRTLVVVGGGRFLRRLRFELLTQTQERGRVRPLMPPALCTIESLAHRALESPRSVVEVSSIDWQIAMASALQSLPISVRKLLLPIDAPVDLSQCWSLAQRLCQVLDRASDALHSCQQIAQLAGLADSPPWQARWNALAQLVDGARSQCASKARPNAAACVTRLECLMDLIEHGIPLVERVVLVGIPDATPATRMVLDRLAEVGVTVDAWVIGAQDGLPEGKSAIDCFDEWGFVRPENWTRGPHLEHEQVEAADGVGDQCAAVVAHYSKAAHSLAPGQAVDTNDVVIVSADTEMNAGLEQRIERSGRSAHFGAGVPWPQTLAGRMVSALAHACRGQHPDDLAHLVAHPMLKFTGAHGGRDFDAVDALDRARVDRLANQLNDLAGMCPVVGELELIFGRFAPSRARELSSSGSWSELALELARIVKGVLRAHAGAPVQASALDELDRLAQRIAQGIWADEKVLPSDVLTAITGMASELQIALPPDGSEVEVIGWLDALHESARAMVVAGVREGTVPSSPTPDGWFNEALCTEVGIANRAGRLARDAYVMHALALRARSLDFVSGRVTASGDPAVPSRLLLPSSGATQAQRIVRLLDDRGAPRLRPRETAPAQVSGFFQVPKPEDFAHLALPDPIRVTDFKAYLNSPYEFWLRRVLCLQSVVTGEIVLSPMQFGTLMHEAMAELGRGALSNETDPKRAMSVLSEWLDNKIATQFGAHPKPGVKLQVGVLKERLQDAVDWHIAQLREGWRVEAVEWSLEGAMIECDSGPQRISGRIDRIDRNTKTLRWRLIDFKTGDRAQAPDDLTRYKGKFQDLQLPLYGLFAPRQFIGGDQSRIDPKDLDVGLVCLAARPHVIAFAPLDLNQQLLDDAHEAAKSAIECIRRREFGSALDSDVSDEFSRLTRAICYSPADDGEGGGDDAAAVGGGAQ